MSNPLSIILESWTRQCTILDNMVACLTPMQMAAQPSEDGWPVTKHFTHILGCRKGWMTELSSRHAAGLKEFDGSESVADLRTELAVSSRRVHDAVLELSESFAEKGPVYEHPLFYLQHMLWHEGYHFGLIMLALRKAGHEPTEIWEEENIWSLWRTDPWFAQQAQG